MKNLSKLGIVFRFSCLFFEKHIPPRYLVYFIHTSFATDAYYGSSFSQNSIQKHPKHLKVQLQVELVRFQVELVRFQVELVQKKAKLIQLQVELIQKKQN